jgi:hypothetical protein
MQPKSLDFGVHQFGLNFILPFVTLRPCDNPSETAENISFFLNGNQTPPH